MHHPSNTLQTLNKQPSMAFSEATKYQNTTSIITFMYFSRATVEAIMLFVCPCEYIRMCRLHTYTDSSSPQLMSSFTPFPFKVQTTSFRDAKLQSLLSISGFPRPVSPPDLSEPSVGGFQMRTACSLSAFSITDGRSLNCSFNSWATKAQTFILVWYRPVRLIFEQFDLWLAHTGVEFS